MHFYCRLLNGELYLLCFVVVLVGAIVIFYLATTHCSLKTQSMVLTLSQEYPTVITDVFEHYIRTHCNAAAN